MSGVSRKRAALLFLGLFALAFTIRMACVLQYEASHPNADYLVIDERSYDEWGQEIASGEWLGEEVFFQEPLYPYFLGSLYAVLGGRDLLAARSVHCLLGALTCVFVWLLAFEVFDRRAAWLASIGFAVASPAIMLPAYLLKPNLFLPLFTAFAWLLLRSRRSANVGTWVLLGALAGAGALLRGNVLVLLPVFAAWPLVRERFTGTGWLRSGALVGGVLLVLLPVALRNQFVGGVFALTTSGAGTNLYGGNNADNVFGIATEFDWVRGIPEHESGDWRREAERRLGRDLDPGEVSSYWMGEVFDSVRRDPTLHLQILFNKLRLTLGAYEVPDNHDVRFDRRYVSLLRWPWPNFALLGALGIAGLLLALLGRRRLERPSAALELGLLFAAYAATIVLTVTSMRIRIALVPILLPFSAYALVSLWQTSREGGPKLRFVRPGILLLISALIVNVPIFDDEYLARRIANREYNFAAQLLDQDRDFDRVAEIAKDLLERYPRSSRVQALAAEVDFRTGIDRIAAANARRGEPGWETERDAGRALVQAALDRLKPLAANESVNVREKFRVRRLAGWIQLWLDNGRAAENHFRAALEFDDEAPGLRLALAQALILHAGALEAGSESREAKCAEAERLLDDLVDEAAVRDLRLRIEELR